MGQNDKMFPRNCGTGAGKEAHRVAVSHEEWRGDPPTMHDADGWQSIIARLIDED